MAILSLTIQQDQYKITYNGNDTISCVACSMIGEYFYFSVLKIFGFKNGC
jgi:hypothetical protein